MVSKVNQIFVGGEENPYLKSALQLDIVSTNLTLKLHRTDFSVVAQVTPNGEAIGEASSKTLLMEVVSGIQIL